MSLIYSVAGYPEVATQPFLLDSPAFGVRPNPLCPRNPNQIAIQNT
jgi:hypothetical protein